jgi:hypothetical protein
MKSKLEIYALSVCFTSVLFLVVSLAVLSYSFIEIVAPEFTMKSTTYDGFQSNKAYWGRNKPYCLENCDKIVKPSEEELTKERVEAFEIAKKGESRSGLQSLIKSFLYVLFSAIALLIHWRIAKNCRG